MDDAPIKSAVDGAPDPNASIPPYTCECLKCACLPCTVCVAGCTACCRERTHPSWGGGMNAAVAVLRTAANNVCRSIGFLRCISAASIPTWCGLIQPTNIGVADNTVAPHKGEWFYPPSGPKSCCCFGQFPGSPQQVSPTRLILYFHGGAYCVCHSGTHRPILTRIVNQSGCPVLAINYRRPPEDPFPASTVDCLESYKWLLENGWKPENIVFGGDSAGGGLVISTMGAARAAGLPMPAGGFCISPWVDCADSFSGTWTTNQAFDYLPRDYAHMCALKFAGTHSLSEVSPVAIDLVGFPPLQIMVGDCECLLDQVQGFVAMAKESGVDVEDWVAVGGIHVFPMFAMFEAEGSVSHVAYEKIASFVDRVVPGGKIEVMCSDR